jgi:tripartite ATP-independent transporter DctM subunit
MPTSDAYELVTATRIRGTHADSVLRRIDRVVGSFVDAGTAALLWAEVAIALATCANRFVGRRARIADVASDLFLWLVMFGSVAALRRGGHLRVSAILTRLPERLQRRCETTAALLVFLFASLLLLPADRSFVGAWLVPSPLGVHDSLRAGALLAGFALMTLVAALQLAERAELGDLLVAINVVSLAGAGLFLAKPFLVGVGPANFVLFFILLLGTCVAMGAPIAFCFGITAIAYISTIGGLPLDRVVSHFATALSPEALLSVPLFILLGYVVALSGVLGALIAFLRAAVGHVAGGCAYVLLATLCWVAAISGFRVTEFSALNAALFPEIRRRGGGERDAVGVLCASGALTSVMPPSIALVLIAAVTGTSLAALFAGSLAAALVGVVGLMLTIAIRMRDDRSEMEERATRDQVVRALVLAAPGLVPLIFMWYAIPAGVVGPPEAAALTMVFLLVVGALIYQQIDARRLYRALVDAGTSSGTVLLVVALAGVLVWTVTQSHAAPLLAFTLGQMPDRWLFMALSVAIFVVLGALLAGLPALLVGAPLLFPVAAASGISAVHFAVVAVLATAIGFGAPPLGGGFLRACRIAQVPAGPSRRVAALYLCVLAVMLLLVAFLPLLLYG